MQNTWLPHSSYFHGQLHTLGYSFNLSGSWGRGRWFGHPQSRLKTLWQECRARGSHPGFGCHVQEPGAGVGGCWQPEESARHIGNGLVWETRLEQSHEPLVTWRETQEGNTDFKGPLHCPTSKKEPNYNRECGRQGQWSSWKPSSVCSMLKVPWSSCCVKCQAYLLAKF